MRVCGRLPLTLVTGVRGERGRGQDFLSGALPVDKNPLHVDLWTTRKTPG